MPSICAVGALVLAAGCASIQGLVSGDPAVPSREDDLRAGAEALARDDFAGARDRLAALSEGCLDHPVTRRAALLRASAELDPGNPDGAPDEAARQAARVLVAAPRDAPERAHARALYRLALDLGGSVPVTALEPRCTTADSAAARLPSLTGPTTAERLRSLADSLSSLASSLAVAADSLEAASEQARLAQERTRAAEQRARALEDELERIRLLLRGGVEPHP